jgi:hypothetical protein
MTARLVADAVVAAGRARDAGHLRAFKHAVNDFIGILSRVPDEPARGVSSVDASILQSCGDEIIGSIEEHVADMHSTSDAQVLVGAVYEIRRLLEEVNHFRQHYAMVRPL